MGRPWTSLTGALLALLLSACATVDPGKPVPTQATTTPSSEPRTHGYRLPQGVQTVLHTGKTGKVSLMVGDTLVVQRTREVGQHPDAAVLTLAEARDDGKLVFQATGPGRTTLYTEDPRRVVCDSEPCPPGVSAPPSVIVEVG